MAEKNQEKVLEFYSLNQKVQQIQEQLELLNHQFTELLVIEESINEMGKGKKSMFMPLGGGVFVDTEIKNSEELLINVGSGVLVKKNLKDSIDIIKTQQKDIKQAVEHLNRELEVGIKELRILKEEISKEEQQ